MKSRSRALWALITACALLGVAPAAGSAAPTISKLRVEAGGQALASGALYVNGSARMATRPSECGGSGQSKTVAGPSAIGLVQYGQQTNRLLKPFFVSDRFDFGLIVCRIGNAGAFDANQAWLYKVNHKEAQVGGDQFPLKRRDEVLWYFADFATGANTGSELGLRAPVRVRPGSRFTVTAIAYDGEGRTVRAEGAKVTGGNTPVETDANGNARVVISKAGTRNLRVTRVNKNDIAGPPTSVCVNANLDRCPTRRPEFIVGTNGADPILGTPAADLVVARGGGDRIDVRDGGNDNVYCGAGVDAVLATSGDRVAPDCERLNGRTRG